MGSGARSTGARRAAGPAAAAPTRGNHAGTPGRRRYSPGSPRSAAGAAPRRGRSLAAIARAIRARSGGLLAAGLVAAGILATGCSNDGSDLVPDEIALVPGGVVSLSRDIQPVLDANCAVAGCHAGPFPEQGMSLERGNLFDPQTGVVGVPSAERPGMNRVQPGSAEMSYLVHKIQGTQASVGGVGEQMPFGAAPLAPETIEAIRAWIDQGAQDN